MAQCVPGRIQDAAGATTEGQRVEWRGGTALMGCTAWLRGWLRLRIGRGHAMAPARGQRRGEGVGACEFANLRRHWLEKAGRLIRPRGDSTG